MRTRETCGTNRVEREYQEEHGADWCAVAYLDRYGTMGPLLHKIGLKVSETQLPVIPLKKSGWPWTTVRPVPKEYSKDGQRVREEDVATSSAQLAGAVKTVAKLKDQLASKGNLHSTDNKRLKDAQKKVNKNNEFLAKVKP